MELPKTDLDYLHDRGIAYTVSVEAGMLCIVLPAFVLPDGYDRRSADLLVRLSTGYPDIPPDMWWFEPAIQLGNGVPIQATEVREDYLGRTWQRWSRHFQADQWQSGIDGLHSYLALISREVRRCVLEPVG